VHKSPIYEQSNRVIGKRKKAALEQYLRIPAVQFLFRYHILLLRYFTGIEKSAFQAKLAKIGQFFVYNFAKKMKIEIHRIDKGSLLLLAAMLMMHGNCI